MGPKTTEINSPDESCQHVVILSVHFREINQTCGYLLVYILVSYCGLKENFPGIVLEYIVVGAHMFDDSERFYMVCH